MNNFSPLYHSVVLVVGVFLLQVHDASCQTGLSSQDEQELLNAHNHFRGIVDPPASNMEQMVMAYNAQIHCSYMIVWIIIYGYSIVLLHCS